MNSTRELLPIEYDKLVSKAADEFDRFNFIHNPDFDSVPYTDNYQDMAKIVRDREAQMQTTICNLVDRVNELSELVDAMAPIVMSNRTTAKRKLDTNG